MRLAIPLLLALVIAACGEADEPAAPTDPDTPAQAPAQTAPPDADPPDPAACERLAERLPGRTLAAAERRASSAGCGLRVVNRDGVALAVTDDFSPTRINVHVRDGEIAGVAGLY